MSRLIQAGSTAKHHVQTQRLRSFIDAVAPGLVLMCNCLIRWRLGRLSQTMLVGWAAECRRIVSRLQLDLNILAFDYARLLMPRSASDGDDRIAVHGGWLTVLAMVPTVWGCGLRQSRGYRNVVQLPAADGSGDRCSSRV